MWLGTHPLVFGVLLLLVHPQDATEEEEVDPQEEPSLASPPPLLPMCDLVSSFGYRCTEHEVTTEDGYILQIYNLECGAERGQPAMVLAHGLFCSSEIFVIKNDSIGYQLCDAGIDLWIINYRGTIHGRRHKTLDPNKDEEFWDASLIEFGTLDVRASFLYIKEKTQVPQLYYLGHSMGTVVLFGMLSRYPELAADVKEAFLLAPVFYTTKYQFLLKGGSPLFNMMMETANDFKERKLWEILPRVDVEKNEHQVRCSDFPSVAVGYCNMALQMLKPLVGDYFPAGVPLKNMEHWGQSYHKGKVSYFDYLSEEGNRERYGRATPPEVDITKTTTKVHLFYSDTDLLVAATDVEQLRDELPNLGSSNKIQNEDFNHVDFVYPLYRESEKVYNDLIAKVIEIVK